MRKENEKSYRAVTDTEEINYQKRLYQYKVNYIRSRWNILISVCIHFIHNSSEHTFHSDFVRTRIHPQTNIHMVIFYCS